MVTPIFGARVSINYTDLNYPINFVTAQFIGVANFGRLAKLENVANNRWTIIGGVGGNYTDSRDTTNEVILGRISNFHLAAFVDNEFRITNNFFVTAGLNVTTGVNWATRTSDTRTMTTSVINFNVKAIFVLAKDANKKLPHADFYLEQIYPDVIYIDSSKTIIVNNYIIDTIQCPPQKEEYVYFNHDSYKIDKDGLENIEQSAFKFKDRDIIITAYCSNVGNDKYNKELALRRAIAVKDKLIKLGIEESTITVINVGIDPDREYDMARRVEIKITNLTN